MDINTLTIGEARAELEKAKQTVSELSALFGQSVEPAAMDYPIGQKVIIRARDAGVHFGTLQSVDGRSVVLTNSRRMWRCGPVAVSIRFQVLHVMASLIAMKSRLQGR